MAIAEAVAERLKGRNHRPEKHGNISTLTDQGATRDLAAAKAGFGSGKTLEAAQAVIAQRRGRLCPPYEIFVDPGKGPVKHRPPVNLADRSMGPMDW